MIIKRSQRRYDFQFGVPDEKYDDGDKYFNR